MTDNERGFTLIELLIVLAIMGILVGITALSLGGLVGSAETTTMNAEKDQVQTAIDVYNTQKVLGHTCCVPAIAAQSFAAKVTPAADTFGQFLGRDTKYYYEWLDDGESLEGYPSPDPTPAP